MKQALFHALSNGQFMPTYGKSMFFQLNAIGLAGSLTAKRGNHWTACLIIPLPLNIHYKTLSTNSTKNANLLWNKVVVRSYIQTIAVTPLHVTQLLYLLQFWYFLPVFEYNFRWVLLYLLNYFFELVFANVINYIFE